MYRKVLIPLDGSPESEKALASLTNLRYEAVLLTRVSSVAHAVGVEVPASPELIEDDLRLCQQYLDAIRARLPDEAVRAVLTSGNPAEQILTLAERENCDLIVMTSHGRTGLRRFLLGSVAERVARYAHCPVLLVGRDALAGEAK